MNADPLEMDDGKELIEMVCTCYESPDDADEEDMHDFSTYLLLSAFLSGPASAHRP